MWVPDAFMGTAVGDRGVDSRGDSLESLEAAGRKISRGGIVPHSLLQADLGFGRNLFREFDDYYA